MRRFLITLLCLVPWIAQAQLESAADLQRGLVGWWRFNEGTGTNAFDLSGNANTGALSGSTLPVWTNGVFGGALFAGGSGYVSAPNATSLNVTDFSICLWIKCATTPATGAGLSGKWSGAGYMLFSNGSGTLRFYRAAEFLTATNIYPSDGKWHHLAVTKSGVTGTFYLDGALFRTGTFSSSTVGPDATPYEMFTYSNGTGGKFTGFIDDNRLYNRALSATEVLNLYCEGGGRTP